MKSLLFGIPYVPVYGFPIPLEYEGGYGGIFRQFYTRREFKIWWRDHAKEFRHRGGDNVTNMGSYLGNALGGNVGVEGCTRCASALFHGSL